MGLAIVMIVGAILGWLAAIVVERADRSGSVANALAGAIGAVAAALIAGDVALATGVSPAQLLWAVLGALAAIIAINLAATRHFGTGRERFDNRRAIGNHRTRP